MTQTRLKNVSVCPYYHRAVELIGRRWSGSIISSMFAGASRFTDIAHAVPGLSDRLLSERLKELECEGIVERNVVTQTPARIEYLLTEKGRDLSRVMEAISWWATRWLHPEHVGLDQDADHIAALTDPSAGLIATNSPHRPH